MSILKVWEESPDLFKSKSLSQILNFIGEGKLRDNNETSIEFRELLNIIPSNLIREFINDCLTDKFENNGFALQDIINQIGKRLGFIVENGLYHGKANFIGYDGIWTSKDNYSYVIEVKTTDAYRINLDVISEYRYKLIESKKLSQERSSLLIIVGRQDTGDLEAQIRGSKHAWDIRLLSSDSLIKLLSLKESLNDLTTTQQINELLKPNEYTRIDKLIDLIFLTSQDLQLSNNDKDNSFEEEVDFIVKEVTKKEEKSSFNDQCILKIQKHLNKNLIKNTRTAFADKYNEIGIINIISKKYDIFNGYWFAFYPHQIDFLKNYKSAYIGFGCGSEELIFLIPYPMIETLLQYFNTTKKENRMYWHIKILNVNNSYYFYQPLNKKNNKYEIKEYKL